jgi:hypothetical protein
VGLGAFGTLTENTLIQSLTQGFLTLAIRHNDQTKTRKKGRSSAFGISSLLVGSDFAGLRPETSVKAILLAMMEANDKVTAMFNGRYETINHVEIVEIYQHKAIQVSRIVNRFMKEDRFRHFSFSPPFVKAIPGYLRLIPDDGQQDNWNRLEITVQKKGDTANRLSSQTLPILFTSITDKAHADQTLLPTNRLIVEALIAKMAIYTKWDRAFSQSLFQLMIPNNFKGFGSLGNMVLIVDEETARYPWELLHDPNGISDKPLAVNTGLIRQLKSMEQRSGARHNAGNRALVIGNPNTGGKYPDLPAAKKEAENVLKILQQNGLEVTDCIEKEDTEIIEKLLNTTYKIIHIASHGIVATSVNEPTGLIIGNEMVFTAGDFNQVSVVPEFVFINTCSSDEYDTGMAERMRRKYDLAANVGTQLIQMGVKAAIVTGWEINDAAAGEFSNEFYTRMFTGQGFGEAVHCARESTYQKFGTYNTWGAYQCYGDPFYSFTTSFTSSEKTPPAYVDPVEVIYELENLDNEIASALQRSPATNYTAIAESISTRMHPGWLKNAAIIEKFASVYTTLRQFKTALDYYQQLLHFEDAQYTVRSLEQYCNVRARHAANEYKNGNISRTAAVKTVAMVIDDLEKIPGNSFERYSLTAASYRRLYEVGNAVESLKRSAKYYRVAYLYAREKFNEHAYYPYFNWMHLALLFASSKNNEGYLQIPNARSELDKAALQTAASQDSASPRFFHKAASCSYNLSLLIEARSTRVAAIVKLVEAAFMKAWQTDGNPAEKDSFLNYLQFIAALFEKLPAGQSARLRKRKSTLLYQLVEGLKQQV